MIIVIYLFSGHSIIPGGLVVSITKDQAKFYSRRTRCSTLRDGFKMYTSSISYQR
ncbi:hypothetical protein BO70DRAFT_38493 [Aspergillus heteromorphus CBS 117.55]|uniref:Uncharacterized protein n=1 Tax=Aspergillus heteromorphus CBS 117.55 TaxID=1448321 RepID=A0A317WCA3_9EURO|nr:uncharacterized protein BO70DRAFT_38493 [Aspergillus heteromorphus CBS 117.55]PWY81770.1 hypothetical protein BO70DRAFT_38493 [Aspergillus heteromorphus CBS 117.55]